MLRKLLLLNYVYFLCRKTYTLMLFVLITLTNIPLNLVSMCTQQMSMDLGSTISTNSPILSFSTFTQCKPVNLLTHNLYVYCYFL